MIKSFMIAITGPTGAGKSTIAQLLAEQIPNSVNIDVDLVKHFIVSGFRYEEPTGIDQWVLLGRNLGMLAANFQSQNYNVIINGYLREQSWAELEKQVAFTHSFLLLPTLEIVKKRNIGRKPESQLDEDAVLQHHDFFSNHKYYEHFIKIDSSNQTADKTVAILKSIVG